MPTVVALQTAPRFGEIETNLAAADALLGDLAPDLLVLPELFATGYAFRDRAEALAVGETLEDGPTVRWLARTSARTGGVAIGGYVERDGGRLYNAAAVYAGGRAVLSYRKVHLFGFERENFDPGPGPFPIVEHRGFRVGVMICFDWRFPEAARTLALAGADVLAHPSNLVTTLGPAAMCTRAVENGVYAVTAGRIGIEHRLPRPRLTFTGGSQIVAPRGEVLAAAPADREARLVAEFEPARARDKVLSFGNDLIRERRPDTYRC
jgi:predicted amidohydrolase